MLCYRRDGHLFPTILYFFLWREYHRKDYGQAVWGKEIKVWNKSKDGNDYNGQVDCKIKERNIDYGSVNGRKNRPAYRKVL